MCSLWTVQVSKLVVLESWNLEEVRQLCLLSNQKSDCEHLRCLSRTQILLLGYKHVHSMFPYINPYDNNDYYCYYKNVLLLLVLLQRSPKFFVAFMSRCIRPLSWTTLGRPLRLWFSYKTEDFNESWSSIDANLVFHLCNGKCFYYS